MPNKFLRRANGDVVYISLSDMILFAVVKTDLR